MAQDSIDDIVTALVDTHITPAERADQLAKFKLNTENEMLEFCNKLDIAALVRIASTCESASETVVQSFATRKYRIFKSFHDIVYGNEAIPSDTLVIADNPQLAADALRLFGQHFQEVHICASSDSKIIFDSLVSNCTGQLGKLRVTSDPDEWYKFHLATDLTPLFAFLSELVIERSAYQVLKYPFEVCHQMTALKLVQCDAKLMQRCLKQRYGELATVHIEYNTIQRTTMGDFIAKHPQLQDLSVIGYQFVFRSFVKLKAVQRIEVSHTNAMMRKLLGKMPLRSVKVWQIDGLSSMLKWLRKATRMRDTLEEMDVCVYEQVQNVANERLWLSLLTFKQIRKLVLNLSFAFGVHQLVEGAKLLADTLPAIEEIELSIRVYDKPLEMNDFEQEVAEGTISMVARWNPDNIHDCGIVYLVRFRRYDK